MNNEIEHDAESIAQRREQMKRELLDEMKSYHRRRRQKNKAVATVSVITCVLLLYFAPQFMHNPAVVPNPKDNIAERSVDKTYIHIKYISDDEVITLLEENHKTGVFAMLDGKKTLLVLDH